MNLLIVDDEAIAIKGMMDGIDWKRCGIDGTVWTAYSASSALMLCDIEMSGDNGIDLLRIVRELNKDLACIFLTCHASFEYAQEAISLGCSDYILKPAPYEVIEEHLRKVSQEVREHMKDREISRYYMGERKEEGETEPQERSQRSAKEIVRQTEEYILQHIADSDLLVSDIAVALFLNKDYLNRVFKKAHGVSISQYLIQERMKLAGMLLKNPGCSVNAAAEKTGYNNYTYFASSFKRYYGCSPMQYKKENQEEDDE